MDIIKYRSKRLEYKYDFNNKKRRESVTVKKHIYFYNFFIIEKKNFLLYVKPEKSLLLTQITNMFLDNETEIGF